MAKTRKKSDLPTKVCPTCRKPFTWRKKWERNWPEIVFCSQRCRQEKSRPRSTTTQDRQANRAD